MEIFQIGKKLREEIETGNDFEVVPMEKGLYMRNW
jgi:hypothetical protein